MPRFAVKPAWLAAEYRLMTVACCVILGACAAIKVGSHYDETTNFREYRTFAWIDSDPYISDENGAIPISPLTHSKVQSAIERELEAKGYSLTDDRAKADFVVAYTIGTRSKISTSYYPDGYRDPGGWHVHDSYYYVREYREHSYTEGTLGVDIFDNRSRKPVWHGWAQKTITQFDREDPTEIVNEGVAKLFETFPY